jgi:carbamoyltransferase
MIVLGIHGGYKREEDNDPSEFAMHDGAAVLVRDGEILAAIEEERLSRIKHTNCFPFRAIRRCLSISEIKPSEIDRIAVNMSQGFAEALDKVALLDDPSIPALPPNRTRFGAILSELLDSDVHSKLRFCHHHVAHAWSAFLPSGLDESLVVSIDGDGDGCSGMVLVGKGRRLRIVRAFSVAQSLGHLYERSIRVVGYSRFDEYKAMALAPYGDPYVYRQLFESSYSLLPDGDYEVAQPELWLSALDAAGLIANARRAGEPCTQMHMDFMAALQQTLERIVFHIVGGYQRLTKQRNLCLAGGVAHNCSMNGKILYSGLFQNVFVQPAAHDAGGALGAALSVLQEESKAVPATPGFRHLFFGSRADLERPIRETLDAWGDCLAVRESKDIAVDTARLLAEGQVVGWVQGRSEFGPRSLGNRSILADPRPATNKDLINEMVKKREQFRPFAPSVLEERVQDYFEVPSNHKSFPFMIFVLRVQSHARKLLGAVTHVDGTARVQTVSECSNPIFWKLIHEFEKVTGTPVLLNTSFNNNAEPIVDSVNDAVVCFLTTGINTLVIDNLIVSKSPEITPASILGLIPSIPRYRKLVRRVIPTGDSGAEFAYNIESTKSRVFGPVEIAISHEMFCLLQAADGVHSVSALLEVCPVDKRTPDWPVSELLKLWGWRSILLTPRFDRPTSG